MIKKAPFCYEEWEALKDNFPFNIQIHKIEGFFENHRHNFLEFFLVFEGYGFEIINGVSHPIKPGTFALILPYQAHELHSNEGSSLKLYNISMRLDMFFGQGNIASGLNEILFRNSGDLSPHVHFEGKMFERVLEIFKIMKSESDRALIWDTLMFKSKIIELLVLFDRERFPDPVKSITEQRQDQKGGIWDVVYYIHNNYADNITLSSLAEHFYLSTSYLSALFKKTMGQNFLEFLTDIRILHACSLLSSTDLSVTQIAFDVGFGSYSSFSRVFLEQKGMSAVEYRKAIKG